MLPTLFHIGDIPVGSFWVMAFLGFFVAFLVVRSEVERHGWPPVLAYDITLAAYVGGWVGARLFMIPTGWELFVEDPVGFLLSSSGWVWYGGAIGGAAGVILLGRRRGVPTLVLGDICAPALALGFAVGRIGCQLSGDGDYGIPTDLPWGMSYPDGVVPTQDRVHPTPVYETVVSLAIFAYLWRRRLSAPPVGDLLGRYLVLSSSLRFLVEFVRRNPAWLVGLTTAQWTSIGLIVLGIALVRHAGRHRGRPVEGDGAVAGMALTA
ncbi:prolipoprotein diacylglyceryl transferase [Candidatus Binatia bacterium]|nr:prolipoprotein diacylglyceryl transferase [Candidatus Binatia bacterium]